VGDAAEHHEGAQLEERAPERDQRFAGGEVEQLQRDGQDRGRDQHVAHLLPLHHCLHRAVVLPPIAPDHSHQRRGHRRRHCAFASLCLLSLML
jgi:hypothetical protein